MVDAGHDAPLFLQHLQKPLISGVAYCFDCYEAVGASVERTIHNAHSAFAKNALDLVAAGDKLSAHSVVPAGYKDISFHTRLDERGAGKHANYPSERGTRYVRWRLPARN